MSLQVLKRLLSLLVFSKTCTHFTNLVFVSEFSQFLQQISAHNLAILLAVIFLDGIQNCNAHSGRQWIASICIEVQGSENQRYQKYGNTPERNLTSNNILCITYLPMTAPISGVVTMAANGNPFPIPLAMVTMSGTTSCASKPQKWSPVLPKPVWTLKKIFHCIIFTQLDCLHTSSEMQTPPSSLALLNAFLRYPFGYWTVPPTPWIDSAKNAAKLWPLGSEYLTTSSNWPM